jgi:hypothetical protein
MRGESEPGLAVVVLVDEGRLRILSGVELVGEWNLDEIGIQALQEGFAIRAEGEEFVLKATDEVGLAEEMGLVVTSPRLARKVAVSNNPEAPPEPVLNEDMPREQSNVGAIAFALGGVLVLLGGSFLRVASSTRGAPLSEPSGVGGDGEFWLYFLVGGLAMVAAAFVMSIGVRWARVIASVILGGVIVLFGVVVSSGPSGAGDLTAYGFIAGGLVVGVAVLFSGTLATSD